MATTAVAATRRAARSKGIEGPPSVAFRPSSSQVRQATRQGELVRRPRKPDLDDAIPITGPYDQRGAFAERDGALEALHAGDEAFHHRHRIADRRTRDLEL